MLLLTRLNGPVFALNPDLIERAEATPDTVVTLVNGTRYVICESLEELAELVRAYRAETAAAAYRMPMGHRAGQHAQTAPSTSSDRTGERTTERPQRGTVVELRPGDA